MVIAIAAHLDIKGDEDGSFVLSSETTKDYVSDIMRVDRRAAEDVQRIMRNQPEESQDVTPEDYQRIISERAF